MEEKFKCSHILKKTNFGFQLLLQVVGFEVVKVEDNSFTVEK